MESSLPEFGKYYVITTNDNRALFGRCVLSAHGVVLIQNDFLRCPDGICCASSIVSCHEVPAPSIEDGELGWLKAVNQSA
jgi:hypothetical protein